MGQLIDLDFPAATPACARTGRARKRRPHIKTDTPIIPGAVAVAVWEEACVWLEVELPRSWIVILAVRANEIYAHNPRFRQLLRRSGTAGRDWLWSFTRHWLAAMISRKDERLYAQLPASYSIGRDLPDRRQGRAN